MSEKYGWDQQGPFTIRYGPNGVKWHRGWPEGAPLPEDFMKIGVSAGLPQVEAAARVVEAVAALGQWYEMHQFRKLSEAQHEERRIQWLADYIQLFVEHMARNTELDAKASCYLSREAERLFDALLGNPRIDVPSVLMYSCSVIHRHLAEFNRSSSVFLLSAFKTEGKFDPAASSHVKDQFKREIQRQHLGIKPISLTDGDLLKYRPAKELLEELIALAEAGKLESLTWEDIAKSALLVSLFIPIPPIEGISLAARLAIWAAMGAAKGGATTAALPHASKMIRHINEFFRGNPSERKVQLLKDFADLMLLKLEADSTTRLLTVTGNLMLSRGVKQLTVASHPQLLLTGGQGQS